jgi:hypothetical protein
VTRRRLDGIGAEQAARLLGERAVWSEQGASLDLEVLFGPLLRDRSIRFIGFQIDDRSFWLPRAFLIKARRALEAVGPLRAWLDAKGLHLRWRSGAGGLNLHGTPAAPRRGRTLSVMFQRTAIDESNEDLCSSARL